MRVGGCRCVGGACLCEQDACMWAGACVCVQAGASVYARAIAFGGEKCVQARSSVCGRGRAHLGVRGQVCGAFTCTL